MDTSELKERTDRIQRQVERLDQRMNDMERNHSVSDVVMDSVNRRLGNIEDSQKWVVRLIIGAILLAVVGAALNGSFAP